jgi:hypothetical protein
MYKTRSIQLPGRNPRRNKKTGYSTSRDQNSLELPRRAQSESRGTKEVDGYKRVPQGSILGPTLWNLYYDGVLRLQMPEGVQVIGYADDLAVIASAKCGETPGNHGRGDRTNRELDEEKEIDIGTPQNGGGDAGGAQRHSRTHGRSRRGRDYNS